MLGILEIYFASICSIIKHFPVQKIIAPTTLIIIIINFHDQVDKRVPDKNQHTLPTLHQFLIH